MKRINLVKYGFVRSPEDDFSDDGNHFTCYTAGRVRVSKLVDDGEAYLSGRIEDGVLTYDEYSKLPSNNDVAWKYNGVSVSSLTEDDLRNFYQLCITYSNEYTDLEAQSQILSVEEAEEIFTEQNKIYQGWFDEIKAMLIKAIEDEKIISSPHRSSDISRVVDSLHFLNSYAHTDSNKRAKGASEHTRHDMAINKDNYLKNLSSYDYEKAKEILSNYLK